MIARLRRYIVGTKPYMVSALMFALVLLVGYFVGGSSFVTSWGGSIAAVWATVYLIYKSQMYWVWTVAYSILWGVLFFQQGLNALGAYHHRCTSMILLMPKTWFPSRFYCGQRIGSVRITDIEALRLLPLCIVRIRRGELKNA